jgi:hypothetical protein
VQHRGTAVAQTRQLHLCGGLTHSRIGLYHVLQGDDGQTVSMDVWAQTAQCLKGMLFQPGCTSGTFRDNISSYLVCMPFAS